MILYNCKIHCKILENAQLLDIQYIDETFTFGYAIRTFRYFGMNAVVNYEKRLYDLRIIGRYFEPAKHVSQFSLLYERSNTAQKR